MVRSLLFAATALLLGANADVPVPPSPRPLEVPLPTEPYWEFGEPETVELWSISDFSPLDFKKRETDRLSDALGTLASDSSAWLLKDGEDFVWVVGKEARGKGWHLDPSYAADSRRWLEVAGRVERCAAALCLRANKVSLTLSPDAAETEVR